jgi:NTP pyrophosphatase (non-canonical NTP hydrolase)
MPFSEMGYIQMDLAKFAADRDWQQFHTPANLAKAISCEAGELLEQFLWNNDITWKNCPDPVHEAISDEVADVFIYLLRLCDVMGIDLIASTRAKMAKNVEKYPVEKCKGSALKYDKL